MRVIKIDVRADEAACGPCYDNLTGTIKIGGLLRMIINLKTKTTPFGGMSCMADILPPLLLCEASLLLAISSSASLLAYIALSISHFRAVRRPFFLNLVSRITFSSLCNLTS